MHMSNEQYPEEKKSDEFKQVLAKGGYSLIPFLGPVVSEYYAMVATEPIKARQTAWLNSLHEKLTELSKTMEAYKPENLSSNDEFISILAQATQCAMNTHQEAKLNAFRNGVANSAKRGVSFDEKHFFIQCVDRLSVQHLIVLKEFDSGGRYENGAFAMTGEIEDVAVSLSGSDGFKREAILNDLNNCSFFMMDYTTFPGKKRSSLNVRISELGKRFLQFISE